MKNLVKVLIITVATVPAIAFASVRVFNSSGSQVGIFTDLKLANGLAVSQVSGKAQASLTAGDGTTAMAGFLQSQYSVSGDLAAAQCGKTVTNDGDGGVSADRYNLPTLSSSILGCRYSFIVMKTAPGMQIKPAAGNQILILTNTAGDMVSQDSTLGASLTLEATTRGWDPVGKEQGTWSDVNQ